MALEKATLTNHAVITLVERVAKELDTGKIVIRVLSGHPESLRCYRPSYFIKKAVFFGNTWQSLQIYYISNSRTNTEYAPYTNITPSP